MRTLRGGLMLIVALLLIAATIPAMAFDVGKGLLGANAGDIILDGYITGGKQFDADYALNNKIDTLTISSGANQWYLEGEAGIKLYDLARPFVKLETLTGVYAERTYGMDLYWPLAGLDAGIRGAYVSNEQYGLSKNKFGYAGLILKF
jgi:hypothetical protein